MGLRLALGLDVGEAQTRLEVAHMSACDPLPATDRDVDIERIEFDESSNPSSPLGREDRRAAAAEGIEDDAVPTAAISDQVGDEADRLGGGMELKITAAGRMQAVDSRIIKDIGAVAALPPESGRPR